MHLFSIVFTPVYCEPSTERLGRLPSPCVCICVHSHLHITDLGWFVCLLKNMISLFSRSLCGNLFLGIVCSLHFLLAVSYLSTPFSRNANTVVPVTVPVVLSTRVNNACHVTKPTLCACHCCLLSFTLWLWLPYYYILLVFPHLLGCFFIYRIKISLSLLVSCLSGCYLNFSVTWVTPYSGPVGVY